ncbi:MAG: hypothetical protein BWY91_01650 [bacterium ADurb.BinA028]|nr:MAG: hypothetical protein BWY91_01650 [bacterium ADurb.BinA028]
MPSICGPVGPVLISKVTSRPRTTGSAQVGRPFFFDSQNERTSGIAMPHAGLGQVTVRAQIHAMTFASRPSGRVASG